MTTMNKQVLLASRPTGEPSPENFDIVQSPMPEAGEGEIVVRTIYLSIDPYMRGRMDDAKSYAASVQIGDVMTGGVVGQIVQSRNPNFPEGDFVLGMFGWQSFTVSDGSLVRKLDPAIAPISTAVGVLGMPGLTAYVGLLDIGEPKPGDTVVVAAASGAVGSVVGQIAKIKGCRVVGIAGPAEKCAYVTDELGFDACVSHRSETLKADLEKACPDGIDVYFENVGGKVFAAVLPLMNDFGRIPVCGLIANYNLTELPPGPDMSARVMRNVLTKRLKIQGFIVTDRYDRFPAFEKEVGGWIRDGSLKYREDIIEGLENAPAALIGVLAGRNFGKMLVRVSDDPSRP
jgi:NADPH-dependent curcumin reductase CurA